LPSQLWYQGDLHPAAANATRRLEVSVVRQPDLVDAILTPQRPVTLVLADHTTDAQHSALEVEIVATLAARLLLDYGIAASRLAILAPHRAQNSAIAQRLAQLLAQRGEGVTLPVIDTVERLQGAERDIVLFSVTSSDPDALDSPFLNNPNRFNVALTRARHKLVVVGSRAFFTQVPHTDTGLQAHYGFTAVRGRCLTGPRHEGRHNTCRLRSHRRSAASTASATARSWANGSSKPGSRGVVYVSCSVMTISVTWSAPSRTTVIRRRKRSMIQYSSTPARRYSSRLSM
jgi:AAA domain-containing protein